MSPVCERNEGEQIDEGAGREGFGVIQSSSKIENVRALVNYLIVVQVQFPYIFQFL